MSATAEKLEIKRELPAVMPARMPLAESARVVFHLTVPQNVTREDMKDPEFWKHVSVQFKPTYRIEVIDDEQTFFAEYLVLDAGKNWAVVEELRYIEFKKHITPQIDIGYEVKYKGPHHKFCVIRKSDGEMIKSQMGKEDAHRSLGEYIKAVNGGSA